MFQENAFSAAAAPDDDQGLAFLDFKRDAIKDLVRPETFLQITNFDH
jgi:hypothetical protein